MVVGGSTLVGLARMSWEEKGEVTLVTRRRL